MNKKVFLVFVTGCGLGVMFGYLIFLPDDVPVTFNQCLQSVIATAKTDMAVIIGEDMCEERFPLGGNLEEVEYFKYE